MKISILYQNKKKALDHIPSITKDTTIAEFTQAIRADIYKLLWTTEGIDIFWYYLSLHNNCLHPKSTASLEDEFEISKITDHRITIQLFTVDLLNHSFYHYHTSDYLRGALKFCTNEEIIDLLNKKIVKKFISSFYKKILSIILNTENINLDILYYYTINDPEYHANFLKIYDYCQSLIFRKIGFIRNHRVQRYILSTIKTEQQLIDAAKMSYSHVDNSLKLFLKDNPGLRYLVSKFTKAIYMAINDIKPQLNYKGLSQLIFEYAHDNVPQKLLAYQFFLLPVKYSTEIEVTEHSNDFIIEGKGEILVFPDGYSRLQSYVKNLNTLVKKGLIKVYDKVGFGVFYKNQEEMKISSVKADIRISDNHFGQIKVELLTQNGARHAIEMGIDTGILKGKKVDWLITQLARSCEAPIEFSQAVIIIAWYRQFFKNKPYRDSIETFLPLISSFIDGFHPNTVRLDIPSFYNSKTFAVLSKSQIIPKEDYIQRSKTLRQYVTSNSMVSKENRQIAREILTVLDKSETKTESFLQDKISYGINKAMGKAKKQSKFYNVKDGFMHGIHEMMSLKTIPQDLKISQDAIAMFEYSKLINNFRQHKKFNESKNTITEVNRDIIEASKNRVIQTKFNYFFESYCKIAAPLFSKMLGYSRVLTLKKLSNACENITQRITLLTFFIKYGEVHDEPGTSGFSPDSARMILMKELGLNFSKKQLISMSFNELYDRMIYQLNLAALLQPLSFGKSVDFIAWLKNTCDQHTDLIDKCIAYTRSIRLPQQNKSITPLERYRWLQVNARKFCLNHFGFVKTYSSIIRFPEQNLSIAQHYGQKQFLVDFINTAYQQCGNSAKSNTHYVYHFIQQAKIIIKNKSDADAVGDLLGLLNAFALSAKDKQMQQLFTQFEQLLPTKNHLSFSARLQAAMLASSQALSNEIRCNPDHPWSYRTSEFRGTLFPQSSELDTESKSLPLSQSTAKLGVSTFVNGVHDSTVFN